VVRTTGACRRLLIIRKTKIWGGHSIGYLPISRAEAVDALFASGYLSMIDLINDGEQKWRRIPGIGPEIAKEIQTALEEAVRIEVAVASPKPKLVFKNPPKPKPVSERTQARRKRAAQLALQPSLL
jgi:hypothetical protein